MLFLAVVLSSEALLTRKRFPTSCLSRLVSYSSDHSVSKSWPISFNQVYDCDGANREVAMHYVHR